MTDRSTPTTPTSARTHGGVAVAAKFNDAFWRWLGDSAVVDRNGEPLVVYHGTGSQFEKFKPGRWSSGAIWFASDPETAFYHAHRGAFNRMRTMPVYLKIEDPWVVAKQSALGFPDEGEIVTAKMRGHDGVIFKKHRDGI